MRDDEEDDVRGGPGWFATLIGATLLLAAGFAVGLVVGAVREEPAMLLQYVTGQTSNLPAPASPPPAGAPAGPQAAPSAAPPPVEAAAPPNPASPITWPTTCGTWPACGTPISRTA